MKSHTILSLFDFSGQWCAPYREAGYTVVQVDLKRGRDVLNVRPEEFPSGVHGILAAPPCTHFSSSGARWWAAKDADGRTAAGLKLVDHVVYLVQQLHPVWWALENPIGRLPKLRPDTLSKPHMYFQPHHYGDPYRKLTALWGNFNTDLPRNDVKPEGVTELGKRSPDRRYTHTGYRWNDPRTKELRSVTPPGFAQAFFLANP